MIDSDKKCILTLVRSAVTGEVLTLPKDYNISILLSVAKKHQIAGLIYYGALNCGVDTNTQFMNELNVLVCKCIAIGQYQMYEIENLIKLFDQKNIDYMLLKGLLLRKLYPRVEMRMLGDVDILIKTEQYALIESVMKKSGFNRLKESDHELSWKKKYLLVELHKRLIPTYIKDFDRYYGDGWKFSTLRNDTTNRFDMSKEDQMIYLFTHFSKHYRDGGIGIKHFTDLYVYRNANKNLDDDYIKKELEKLHLYEFYINVLETLQVWFEDGKTNDKTDFITNVILGSGVYGEHSKIRTAQTLRAKKSSKHIRDAKFKRFLEMIFPSIDCMKLEYSFLKKAPFLLPISWFLRAVDIIFNRRKKAIKFYEDMKKISNEDVLNYEKALRYVGLDFNFGE